METLQEIITSVYFWACFALFIFDSIARYIPNKKWKGIMGFIIDYLKIGIDVIKNASDYLNRGK